MLSSKSAHIPLQSLPPTVAISPSRRSLAEHDIFRLCAALFIWYLVVYVFLPIPAVHVGVDSSWRAFLPWAFEHHKQFGTEVIFTYGPWGFLLEPMGTIAVYPWQILGRLIIALAASSGIALVGVSWVRSAPLRWIWASAIVILAEPAILVPVLLFLCTAPSIIESRRKLPVLLLMACAAGLAACTKFTCFLLVAALLPVLAVRRKWLPALAVCPTSFLFFWLLARQNLLNIPAFVHQSLEISNGYSAAMVTGRPQIELPLALLICGLPLVQWAAQTLPPLSIENAGRLCWLAVCEFLIFKNAIIRSDPQHYYMAFIAAGLPVACLLAPASAEDRRVSRSFWNGSFWNRSYCVLLAVALCVSLSSASEVIGYRFARFEESFLSYPAYATRLPSLLSPTRIVSSESDTVDVFPYQLSYALARGLPLRNTPVIQAYSAYTKALTEEDAAYLEGPNAPTKIYCEIAAIDGRYPPMEDSLAWRSLLTHYAPSSVQDGYVVLKHRERPARYQLKRVLDRDIRTDEVLKIPEVAGGLVWAELEVEKTVTGRLLNLLYRNEKMGMRIETDQELLDFVLLDETASVGFLLSPYLSDEDSMMDIFRPESDRTATEKVRTLLIHRGVVASLGFRPHVHVRLYSLVIPAAE